MTIKSSFREKLEYEVILDFGFRDSEYRTTMTNLIGLIQLAVPQARQAKTVFVKKKLHLQLNQDMGNKDSEYIAAVA
jgi:hypothetical protein